jgi:alpha-L-arabinofuranosidase
MAPKQAILLVHISLVVFLVAQGDQLPRTTAGDTALTSIEIQDQVLREQTKKLGMNLGTPTFYGVSQTLKNLLYRNPGFEGTLFQSILQCHSATNQVCVDGNRYSGWKDGFWDGASVEIATGLSKGARGVVVHSGAPTAKSGISLSLSLAGSARIDAGDYIILRRSTTENPTAGWWPEIPAGATMTAETRDLPPGTLGKQALKIQSASAQQSVALRSYFGDGTYIKLHGRYRLRFSAKSLDGHGRMNVRLYRQLPGQHRTFLDRWVDIPASWKAFDYEFEANELTAPVNGMELGLFFVSPASVLLDEFSLTEVARSNDDSNPMLSQVVDTLRELSPGILRDWSNQLGESLVNWTAPRQARQRSVYSAFGSDNDVSLGIHEFLQLAESIHAEPWIVVPTVFSLEEAGDLIEYLAGPSDSPWGKVRAQRGHPIPWTDVNKLIHLEFGNEAWNGIFAGGSIEDATAYGSRAQDIFKAMRASRWFQSRKFNLVIGGQSGYMERNSRIQAACSANDSFAVAPYTAFAIDHFASPEELFGSLFAESDDLVKKSYTYLNYSLLRASKHPVPLSVYEVNLHSTEGSISQEALDQLTPSIGAGISVAEHMLLMLRELGIRDQNFFDFAQTDFERSDKKHVRLWGAVVNTESSGLRRPQFLALKIVNQALGGEMLGTRQLGADPHWHQNAINGVKAGDHAYISSFAFRKNGNLMLVLFNRHREKSLPITLSGVLAPTGSIRRQYLHAPAITSNNEIARTVVVSEDSISAPTSSQPLLLPPFSLTLLTWTNQAH